MRIPHVAESLPALLENADRTAPRTITALGQPSLVHCAPCASAGGPAPGSAAADATAVPLACGPRLVATLPLVFTLAGGQPAGTPAMPPRRRDPWWPTPSPRSPRSRAGAARAWGRAR